MDNQNPKTKQQKHGKLYRSLITMSVLPLLFSGIIITVFGFRSVQRTVYDQVEVRLQSLAQSVLLSYDALYPGDYHLEGDISYELYKGDAIITKDYSVIDNLKEKTGVEFTIFYRDTRILTTLYDGNTRLVGTGASSKVLSDVLLNGHSMFYSNTTIGNEIYFAYYEPIRNSDGYITGMVYAGMPIAVVKNNIRSAVVPIIVIALISMFVVALISASYSQKLMHTLSRINNFLSKVSSGDLTVEMEPDLLNRGDELGAMAYAASYMKQSIRNLVEKDPLTDLNNRRFADKRLRVTLNKANTYGTRFVVGIGDIDFFKSVNDTYGHECGDFVLKKVATILKSHMLGKGFVARWGGEEFLFVFEDSDLEKARIATENILKEIREAYVPYDDHIVKVTMTYGLCEGGINSVIKDMLQIADNRLYLGKTGGRNRVVTTGGEDLVEETEEEQSTAPAEEPGKPAEEASDTIPEEVTENPAEEAPDTVPEEVTENPAEEAPDTVPEEVTENPAEETPDTVPEVETTDNSDK